MTTNKLKLSLGVASTAIIAGLAATPATAACTVDGTTVTCDATSTVADIEAAIASVAGDDVTLINAATGEIVQPDFLLDITRSGTVGFDNAGQIGAAGAEVYVRIFGDRTAADNDVTIDNSGDVEGYILAVNVGGNATADNSGSAQAVWIRDVTGNIDITSSGDLTNTFFWAINAYADGDVSVVSSGDNGSVGDGTTTFSDLGAIGAWSNRTSAVTQTTVETVGTATTTTRVTEQSQFGSSASIDQTDGLVGQLEARGHEGASIAIAGQVGAADQNVTVIADSSFTDTDSTRIETVDAGTLLIEYSQDSLAGGGAATIDVADTGVVWGSLSAFGHEGADIEIEGQVGAEGSRFDVRAQSTGDDSSYEWTYSDDGAVRTYDEESSSVSNGGDASVTVAEGASVNANVTAFANGSASVTVNAALGDSTGAGNATAETLGSTSNREYGYVQDLVTGDYMQMRSSETIFDADAIGATVVIGEAGVVNTASARSGGGAQVTLDGTAATVIASGLESEFRNVNSSSVDGTTGATTSSNENWSSRRGAEGSVTIGETGEVDRVIASGFTAATVTNDGIVNDSVQAGANSSDSYFLRQNTDDADGFTTRSEIDRFTGVGGDAVIVNNGLIGDDPAGFAGVFATGAVSASLDNEGRINGFVRVNSEANDRTTTRDWTTDFSVDATTGVETTVSTFDTTTSVETLGGDASVTNGADGIITRYVNAFGDGSVTNVNEGIVIGTTYLSSEASDSESDYSEVSVNVFTPAADGGTVRSDTYVGTSSSTSAGGDVAGVYAGSNGAVQFAPDGGGSDGSVTQYANGDSSALVSGLIIGNFRGDAYSTTNESSSETSRDWAYDATGTLRAYDEVSSFESSTVRGTSQSTLDVIAGTITGTARVYGEDLAGVTVGDGGAIEGSALIYANRDASSGFSRESSTSRTYDATGALLSEAYTYNTVNDYVGGDGMAVADIEDGSIGGFLGAYGDGGVDVSIGAAGEVGNSLDAVSDATDGSTTYDYAYLFDAAAGTMATTDQTITRMASGGDVTVDVAGVVGNFGNGASERGEVVNSTGGDLYAYSNAGDVDAMVSGQVADNISVVAVGTDWMRTTSEMRVDGVQVAYDLMTQEMSAGGSASLTADAADPGIPANFGNVYVDGDTSASLTVTAGTVLAGAQEFTRVDVRSDAYVSAYGATNVFDADTGALTGVNYVSDFDYVSGEASLDNAGEIGFGTDSDMFYENTLVYVQGVDSASVTNSGLINGSVAIDSVYENIASANAFENVGDVTQTNLIMRDYEAMGGMSNFANSGDVTGNVIMHAGEGMGTNDGLIRGQVQLGVNVNNYMTEQLDTLTQFGDEEVTAVYDPLVQNYTFDQNGVLMGGVYVGGVFGAIDDSVVTSAINATINLNDGSLTWGTIEGEWDDATGERFTDTDVNLNGSGQLGAMDVAGAAARIVGVDTVTKANGGAFLIIGEEHDFADADNAYADFTLDIGTLMIADGELQVAAVGDDNGIFSIQGDVMNDGSLVMGYRMEDGTIAGNDIVQVGNFSQGAGGNLAFGFSSVEGVTGDMVMADAFYTLVGDATIDGNVELVSNDGTMLMGGETLDFMSVSGAVAENASASYAGTLNFIDFDVETRDEDGNTIVFVQATRLGYDTVAGDDNEVAGGSALTAALPGLVDAAAACDAGTTAFGTNCDNVYDLLGVLREFESNLTTAQVAQALDEMTSGDVYGSLATVSTTDTFVDAISHRRVPMGAKGANLWFAPAATFLDIDGDATSGANELDVENYGGTMGFGYQTGAGEVGFGFGVAQTEAEAAGAPVEADAETWMAGLYGRHAFGDVAIGASVVYGWSDWEATRAMPFLGRVAGAEFDSTELRANATAEYRFALGGSGWAAPFGEVEYRKVNFDGFTEEGAGGLNLVVADKDESLFIPTLGVRLGTAFNAGGVTLRPEGSISYSFANDIDTGRTAAFAGAPASSFRLQGVDTDGYATFEAGLFADFGPKSSGFLRGGLSTGGGISAAGIRAGVSIGL